MSACFSGEMPIPVSETAKCNDMPSLVCDSTSTRKTTSPCSVNLMALPIKFRITWRRRTGSPTTKSGNSGGTKHANSRPFSWARASQDLHGLSQVIAQIELDRIEA